MRDRPYFSYLVKEILDSKFEREKYFVDWERYSLTERSWESLSSITHADDESMSFHDRFPNKPSWVKIRPSERRLAGARR